MDLGLKNVHVLVTGAVRHPLISLLVISSPSYQVQVEASVLRLSNSTYVLPSSFVSKNVTNI